MVFLDSDIVINFLRKEKKSTDLIKKLENDNEEINITTINEFELWKGALRSTQIGSIKILKEFLGKVNVFSFDSPSSKKSAEIFENLRLKGEIIDALDIMIASIVIVKKDTLITNNKKHFERINELNIFSP